MTKGVHILMALCSVVVLRGAARAEGQTYPNPQYPAPPAQAPPLVALQALLGAEAIEGVSEVVRDGDDVIIRIARADAAAELARVPLASRRVLEIRVHRNASGQVESITRSGDLPTRRTVRVGTSASAEERSAALAVARYGSRDKVLSHLRQRAWGPLGGRAALQEATLQWLPSGGGLEAVWVVTLTVQRPTGAVGVVATIDAGSGTVLSLTRQGA